jgi:hypothetical protein
VAKLEARLLATDCSTLNIPQKYKMNDISKEVANTLQPAKKIKTEECLKIFFCVYRSIGVIPHWEYFNCGGPLQLRVPSLVVQPSIDMGFALVT